MSKQDAKETFMEKLRLYTSLYFCDEEAAGIQNDYASWFEAEALAGKSNEEICAGFGEPKRIVRNLLAESGLPNGISLFFRNTFLQILFLTAVHFFADLFFWHLCNKNGWNYAFFAMGANFCYFGAGCLLLKRFREPERFFLSGHFLPAVFALFLFLSELLILPRLTGPHAGPICGLCAGAAIAAVFGAGLYGAAKVLPVHRQRGFLLLLHLFGILNLLFFLCDQLHMLYADPSEISRLIWGSAGIYLETILLGAVFCLLKRNAKG